VRACVRACMHAFAFMCMLARAHSLDKYTMSLEAIAQKIENITLRTRH